MVFVVAKVVMEIVEPFSGMEIPPSLVAPRKIEDLEFLNAEVKFILAMASGTYVVVVAVVVKLARVGK